MTNGVKTCQTCKEDSPYDAKWCIICGEAYPGYTGGTKRLGDVVLGDKVGGDVIYGNKMEYGSNYFHSSPFLLASGVPHYIATNGRLKITGAQYWDLLSRYELKFDVRTGDVFVYGYPVDIEW